jgi:hypothetical protein
MAMYKPGMYLPLGIDRAKVVRPRFSWDKMKTNLKNLLTSFIEMIQKRLLSDEIENCLAMMTAILTNLSLFQPLTSKYGPEPFFLRVLEQFDIVGACRYTTNLEDDITDESLLKQAAVFF